MSTSCELIPPELWQITLRFLPRVKGNLNHNDPGIQKDTLSVVIKDHWDSRLICRCFQTLVETDTRFALCCWAMPDVFNEPKFSNFSPNFSPNSIRFRILRKPDTLFSNEKQQLQLLRQWPPHRLIKYVSIHAEYMQNISTIPIFPDLLLCIRSILGIKCLVELTVDNDVTTNPVSVDKCIANLNDTGTMPTLLNGLRLDSLRLNSGRKLCCANNSNDLPHVNLLHFFLCNTESIYSLCANVVHLQKTLNLMDQRRVCFNATKKLELGASVPNESAPFAVDMNSILQRFPCIRFLHIQLDMVLDLNPLKQLSQLEQLHISFPEDSSHAIPALKNSRFPKSISEFLQSLKIVAPLFEFDDSSVFPALISLFTIGSESISTLVVQRCSMHCCMALEVIFSQNHSAPVSISQRRSIAVVFQCLQRLILRIEKSEGRLHCNRSGASLSKLFASLKRYCQSLSVLRVESSDHVIGFETPPGDLSILAEIPSSLTSCRMEYVLQLPNDDVGQSQTAVEDWLRKLLTLLNRLQYLSTFNGVIVASTSSSANLQYLIDRVHSTTIIFPLDKNELFVKCHQTTDGYATTFSFSFLNSAAPSRHHDITLTVPVAYEKKHFWLFL